MTRNAETVGQTIRFALTVCLVCALAVSSAAVMLRPMQEANRLLDRQMNILRAAELYQPGMDVATVFEAVEHRFVQLSSGDYVDMPEDYEPRRAARDPELSMRLEEDPARIRRLPEVAEVYLIRGPTGELTRIILPVHGYGLWSTMYGFLALEADGETVAGIQFYDHGETPGLGGEIDNPNWQARWVGKRVFDEQGELRIRVVKGPVRPEDPDAPYEVDAISGATLTSEGVGRMVRFWLGEQAFGPYLERVRRGAA
jgi:Na+-transporting NADH:ubiquinone oxidoreductase subunit C